MQQNAFLVQTVRSLCFLVFDFAVYPLSAQEGDEVVLAAVASVTNDKKPTGHVRAGRDPLTCGSVDRWWCRCLVLMSILM
eukprot:3337051-Rhodomonas_salina.1